MEAIKIYIDIKKLDSKILELKTKLDALYMERSRYTDMATLEIEKREYNIEYILDAWDSIDSDIKKVSRALKTCKNKRSVLVIEFNDMRYNRDEQDFLLQLRCAMEYGL